MIFLFILIAGIGFAIYYFIEAPKQNTTTNPPMTNLSLRFLDGDKQVATGYRIYLNNINNLYSEGKTTTDDYTFLQVPNNSIFTITNYNLEGQSYYLSPVIGGDYNGQLSAIRVDLPVNRIGNINYTTDGILGVDNPIYLNISADGMFRLHTLCFRWSRDFVEVALYNYTYNTPPIRLTNKVDRCYKIGQILNETTNISLPIYYKKLQTLGEMDEINITLVDGDVIMPDVKNIVFEDINGTDVGSPDVSILIKGITI